MAIWILVGRRIEYLAWKPENPLRLVGLHQHRHDRLEVVQYFDLREGLGIGSLQSHVASIEVMVDT
jgi:hypothetical protein